ncbi:MAG TPA: hypothetical protein DET40_21800 [Lentisphaeria bacterium]|nr:MAG: hypothetical protein A2X45_14175 [Lentisphaerae bacterium GWF2_50_93]HCE46188.1 hypothetical protein [Lentisphaeria bacterium]
MTTNEAKLIRGALKPFQDSGLIAESTMQEIMEPRPEDNKAPRPDLLTRREACEILKCSGQSMINWHKAGLITPIKLAGKRAIRYRMQDVEALLSTKNEANS